MKYLIPTLLLILTACTNPPGDVHTPLGIAVISNGYNPDIEVLDDKYLAAMQCANMDPDVYIDTFTVEIETDGDSFSCPEIDSESDDPICAGMYDPMLSLIHITEDLEHFAHELGHHQDHSIYNTVCVELGSRDDVHVGSLSVACGDKIDGYVVQY
jgi:hypothetical protein